MTPTGPHGSTYCTTLRGHQAALGCLGGIFGGCVGFVTCSHPAFHGPSDCSEVVCLQCLHVLTLLLFSLFLCKKTCNSHSGPYLLASSGRQRQFCAVPSVLVRFRYLAIETLWIHWDCSLGNLCACNAGVILTPSPHVWSSQMRTPELIFRPIAKLAKQTSQQSSCRVDECP